MCGCRFLLLSRGREGGRGVRKECRGTRTSSMGGLFSFSLCACVGHRVHDTRAVASQSGRGAGVASFYYSLRHPVDAAPPHDMACATRRRRLAREEESAPPFDKLDPKGAGDERTQGVSWCERSARRGVICLGARLRDVRRRGKPLYDRIRREKKGPGARQSNA